MSEIAYRRYHKAATIKEAKIEDALEASLWELRNPEETDPTQHVIIIKAYINEEGLHYSMTQAGSFNVAERMGLIAQIAGGTFNR